MTKPFKSKYKPDCLSLTYSLDEHIAAADPHSQYLLKSDIPSIDLGDLLVYEHAFENLGSYTSTTDTTIIGSNVINEIYTRLSGDISDINGILHDHQTALDQQASSIGTVNASLTAHRTRYTQAQATYTGRDTNMLTDHIDNDGYNLYAGRTHNHDAVYAAKIHSHTPESINAAPIVHGHDAYVKYNDLSEVGIYKTSVNVKQEYESARVNSLFDCNEYKSQGSYFFDDTVTYLVTTDTVFLEGKTYYIYNTTTLKFDVAVVVVGSAVPSDGSYYEKAPNTIVNGPPDVEGGFLIVSKSENSDGSSGIIMQIMYSQLSNWKRTIKFNTVNGATVYEYDSWVSMSDSIPIGTFIFSNRRDVPSGFLEANGATIRASAYPLLWRFAKDHGLIVRYANRTDNGGAFALANDSIVRTSVIDETYVGYAYVEDVNKHFVLLTDSNKSAYLGETCYYCSKTDLDDNEIEFCLPNLNGRFLKMYANGSSGNFGVSEKEGLPNITGTFAIDMNATDRGGAFSYGTSSIGKQSGSGDGTAKQIYFNANKSNSIYGASTHVTPINTSIRVFIKAYNGSLLREDVAVGTIQDIIIAALENYSYATTSTAGFVRLATDAIASGSVEDDSVRPSVITAAQLINTSRPMVKSITMGGITYTPDNGNVILPYQAIYGCRVGVVNTAELSCIMRGGEVWWDVAFPESLEEIVSASNFDISGISIQPYLRCVEVVEEDENEETYVVANPLGYPVGSIIPNPSCVYTTSSGTPIITQLNTTVFKPEVQSSYKIRIYNPLMWYMKKYGPLNSDGSKMYPVTLEETSDAARIERACRHWTLNLKVSV